MSGIADLDQPNRFEECKSSKDALWSYVRHGTQELKAAAEMQFPSCYADAQSINFWRHKRLYRVAIPLLEFFPSSSWMTVGDGNFGSDAHFLRQHGALVLATSITDGVLAVAQQHGFIGNFKAVNAEEIPFPDGFYDFVFCKESYHHFPRPPIALYEMLRVARKAVLLIEPQETSRRPLNRARDFIKTRIRGQRSVLFEPCGNFVFRVNVPEVEKMMTALNYPAIAVQKSNGFYHRRLSHARYSPFGLATILHKLAIATQNILCRMRLLDYGGASMILFKEVPEPALVQRLRRDGFRVMRLPSNPYLAGLPQVRPQSPGAK